MIKINSKDYEEIAEIIKKRFETWKFAEIVGLARDLASYFEKEDKKSCLACCRVEGKSNNQWKLFSVFNRQKFLLDCGVEK